MWRRMLRMVGVGVFVVEASCSFSPEGLDVEGAGTTTNSSKDPSSTSAMPSLEGAASAPGVRRAHDVEVKRLSVGVLFAHEVQAKNATVTTSGPPLPAAELQAQAGTQDIEAPDLAVDVLFANDVKVQVLSVRELHVTKAKIGKENPDD
jgi:hypothetical protein